MVRVVEGQGMMLIDSQGFTFEDLKGRQAPGAIPNGASVVKIGSKPPDMHQDGAPAIVLCSVGPIPYRGDPKTYGYFVEWADLPGVPVFIEGSRIRELPV
jgi:hypothetical protein